MHIIDNIALISINETLFVQLISFLVFLFIINRIMFKPLRSTMSERSSYISDLKKSVIDAKEEMDSLVGQLEEREANAKNEAFNFKQKLEDSGTTNATEIFNEAREQISVLREKAQKEVNKQITDAKDHFSEETQCLATIIMEKVLNRRLTS